MYNLIDGKKVASEIKKEIAEEVSKIRSARKDNLGTGMLSSSEVGSTCGSTFFLGFFTIFTFFSFEKTAP